MTDAHAGAKRCAAPMFNIVVHSFLCAFMGDCSEHHRWELCKPWKLLDLPCQTAAILGPTLTTLNI